MHPIRLIFNKRYLPLLIFATAMGFLEAIVLVYVREIYYPEGFNFPLKTMSEWMIVMELARELCTLFMLGAVAWISGKIFLQRLSVFLFIFGVWDIVYYVALKIFLGWPESLFTWDILFLIPITWVAPVLAPVICSFIMIIIALIFNYLQTYKNLEKLMIKELIFLFAGAAVIYTTFTVDFGMILLKGNYLQEYFNLAQHPEFLKILASWEPVKYNWGLFALGILIILFGIHLITRRCNKENS
jgi:hypothetical protein